MPTLTATVKQPITSSRKILLEIDAHKFERLAATFGFFNPDFIDSLDRAESDYQNRRVKTIASLKELRQ